MKLYVLQDEHDRPIALVTAPTSSTVRKIIGEYQETDKDESWRVFVSAKGIFYLYRFAVVVY